MCRVVHIKQPLKLAMSISYFLLANVVSQHLGEEDLKAVESLNHSTMVWSYLVLELAVRKREMLLAPVMTGAGIDYLR